MRTQKESAKLRSLRTADGGQLNRDDTTNDKPTHDTPVPITITLRVHLTPAHPHPPTTNVERRATSESTNQ